MIGRAFEFHGRERDRAVRQVPDSRLDTKPRHTELRFDLVAIAAQHVHGRSSDLGLLRSLGRCVCRYGSATGAL